MSPSRDAAASRLNAIWYGGSWLSWLLLPVSWVYRVLVALRRGCYQSGLIRSVDVGVPVVVVGNLTVGGTGKTPLTIWLATRLLESGLSAGIVCRGYAGASPSWPRLVDAETDAGSVGDEAVLLARRTGCPVAAGPDRAEAAALLLESAPVDVVLSDDGLQHYRLRRSFEIAVIDGLRGLGNGRCLPAGPLREPRARLQTVDALVVNDGDFDGIAALCCEVRAIRVYELATRNEKSLEEFAGQAVHAVAAIGNPDRFFDLLSRHGVIVEPYAFVDHAELRPEDLSFDDDHPVLMTEKDAVKCESAGIRNLWCVVTELEFAPGDGERLERDVIGHLQRMPENR